MGKIPKNLDEMINIAYIPSNPYNGRRLYETSVLSDMHKSSWFSNSELWYHWLDDKLSDYIYNNYRFRPFLDKLLNDFCEPFENYCHFYYTPQEAGLIWDNGEDWSDLSDKISDICHNIFLSNQEKYKKLFDAMTLEFNPLWNVDGVEETVRTLERDGSIVNAKSGNDESAKTGSDALVKSGTVTDAESGSTATAHTGTITTTDSGTETTVYNGTETNTRNGARTNAKTGGKTTTESEATTDSQSFLNVKKTVESYTDGVSIPDGEIDTETYTNLADVKTFNQRQDQVTKNLSNLQTNANTDTTTHGKTDTTTFNNTDTQNYNSKDKTTYNSSNTETIDTLDTERTTVERHGNIGVTTTTKLLSELVDYSQYFNYVDIIAKDLINAICEGVY